ncbi:MAG: DNA-processing protein DprA [candidate division WOR-3 bacterium]
MAGLNSAFFDLYAVEGMTETRLKRLLERFRTTEAIFEASDDELLQVERADEKLVRALRGYHRSPELSAEIEAAQKAGVTTVSYLDDEFPENLKSVPHMPPVLFVRGRLEALDRLAVAVVGTRRATHYGAQTAERLARELAQAGVTVVSGLARGIDTYAHKGALAGGGRTIAVLGCGIDQCYPPENRKLLEQIVGNGAVLTEFPPGVSPLAMNFPKRNRIVSALARAVIAVEAGEKSGVLNTVEWAVEQGRTVFAVPGRLTDAQSVGTNRLLREGASPLTAVEDVLAELGVSSKPDKRTPVEVGVELKPVLDYLGADPLHIDEISEGLGLPMARLLSLLLELELKGAVKQLPGKFFVRS